jgi:thiol-disulfide isomerase/thioredoxin
MHMKVILVLTFFLLSLTTSASSVEQSDSPRKSLEKALLTEKGNVVYIDFWASWCGPCVKSFPWMNKIQQQYKDQGFTVVSINLDADKVKATQFLKDNPSSFSVIYDSKGSIAKHFSIQGMPTSILINRNGDIEYRHSGFFTGKIDQYENEIQQLLNKPLITLSTKTNRGHHESE